MQLIKTTMMNEKEKKRRKEILSIIAWDYSLVIVFCAESEKCLYIVDISHICIYACIYAYAYIYTIS